MANDQNAKGALQADTLTGEELEQFHGALAAAFPSRSPAYKFPPEDAAKAGFHRAHPVFSVISSSVTEASMCGCGPILLSPNQTEADAL